MSRRHYPFAAIIGQEDLKLCLILCAIDPSIGGVLIRGDKGTAKSTAARGISHLMPSISVGYNTETNSYDQYNQAEEYKEVKQLPTPFIELPIGATEDRVLGSIDFSATLKQGGKRVFSPGLLASANRGVLYVDEVNLLPAHLVDVLLDAAACGVNTVQREGVSHSHPAKFMLIGTMNQEEGDLRPQLLDRFGLMVDVTAPTCYNERAEVVRQRIAFERDSDTFQEKWKEVEIELAQKIQSAKDLLPEVVLSDDMLLLISRICTEMKVGSLRADITLYKTAIALAAYEGRLAVQNEDIRRASEWVLSHRRRQQPFESPNDRPNTNDLLDKLTNNSPPENQDDPTNNEEPDNSEGNQQQENDTRDELSSSNDTEQNEQQNHQDNSDEMQTFTASRPNEIKKLKLSKQQQKANQPGSGRRNTVNNTKKGHYVRSAPTDKLDDLAIEPTLRSAAVNGLSENGMPIILPNNWRRKVKKSTTDTIILFVVDASGSMSARKRMEAVKGSVLALLSDAYQQRDKVGVIAFRGLKAEILLEPTKSVELAEKQLQRLPTGGRTPLAHSFSLSYDTIQRLRRHESDQAILLIVLSDGKGNVMLPGSPQGSDAWQQTEQMASKLATLATPTLMVDTEMGNKYVRVGKGKELAHMLGASYLQLDELNADGLVITIRQAIG